MPSSSASATKILPSKLEEISALLRNDNKVKVAGIDGDGLLRGKIVCKSKFLSAIESGFGFSSIVFGWDMQDVPYEKQSTVSGTTKGFGDFTAMPDLASFRRIPWEDNIPFFLLDFYIKGEVISVSPRTVIASFVERLSQKGYKSNAGVELEFANYQTPMASGYGLPLDSEPSNIAAFLEKNPPGGLRSISQGMFGYSITRPTFNKKYFYSLFDTAERFDCAIETYHTESAPGTFEAALKVSPVAAMADKVSLFKYLTKSIATDFRITPCFMAKPAHGLPGNSGHIHISLTDNSGQNVFARPTEDLETPWPDLAWVSDIGRQFLAGLLEALPDIMPLLAPTINSYKRLVENYWAPVTVSWGLEDRGSSLRLIAPPTCSPNATRIEVRVPGADLNPHYALAAILGAGWRGIEKKMDIPLAPLLVQDPNQPPERLARDLRSAVDRFERPESVARDIFGDVFVDHFAQSRRHELRIFAEAVTDWEVKRYIETV